MKKDQKSRYTLVLHDARKKLGLSKSEYAVADSIYHLSVNPRSIAPGWCYSSKESIAEFNDISPKHVFKILKILINKGIVEKDADTRYLRTTSKWYETVITMNRMK